MNSPLLNERQIWFLDNLVAFMLENYDLSKVVDYTLFKTKIEEWQQYGFYDDAMIYFWYYEPIQFLHSEDNINYLNFCKVIQSLGFNLPSNDQVLIINTLTLIEAIEKANTIHDKQDKIIDLGSAWEYGNAYGLYHFKQVFTILMKQNFFEYDCDNDLFNSYYERLVRFFNLWKARYPTKEQIYLSLIIQKF